MDIYSGVGKPFTHGKAESSLEEQRAQRLCIFA